MPHQAAPGRREPDGAAGVLAQGGGTQEGPGGGAGAAAGPTGVHIQVPGVSGRAEPVGEACECELGEVGLAQKNCAGLFQVCDHSGVLVGDEICIEAGATGGTDAFGPELVLHRHRDAMHRAEVVAPAYGLLCFPRRLQGLVAGDGEVGVEFEVQAVDPVKVGLGGLHRRDFFLFDQT